MSLAKNQDTKTRWGPIAVALALACVVWFLAPRSWEAGAGTLQLEGPGGDSLGISVEIGSRAPIDHSVVHPSLGTLHLEMAGGMPTDGRISGSVTLPPMGDLSGLSLSLDLPGDASTSLPITELDASKHTVRFGRRPPQQAHVVLAIALLVLVLWITNAIPLWTTALLVPLLGVALARQPAQTALAPFFHPIIALFLGGFLMAEAMKRVGLDRRIATGIMARAGRTPFMLFAATLGLSAVLSMFMSNTASTALLIPIALAVTAPLHAPGYRRALVLGLAYAGTVGGIGSAIGTPANLLAIEFLGTYGDRHLHFVDWFAVGLPALLVMLPVIGLYMWWRMDARVDVAAFQEAHAAAEADWASTHTPSLPQAVVASVFLVTVGLWLAQAWHGVHPGVIALGAAVALVILGHVKSEDLQRISWGTLLTFGGGLALGQSLVESGTCDWLALYLTSVGPVHPLISTLVVGAVALILTALASNTAAAAILIPLTIPLAGPLGMDMATLVLIVALATSIDFALVIGTPPTMLAYSTGLFTTGRIFKIGIVLDLVCLGLLVTVVRWIWVALGVVP